MIFELHKQYGKSWSKIAEHIPGRTDNSVKNRFYSTLRRNLRKYNKSRPHSQRFLGSVRTILRNPDIPDVLLQEHAPPRSKKKNQQKPEEKNEVVEESPIIVPKPTEMSLPFAVTENLSNETSRKPINE